MSKASRPRVLRAAYCRSRELPLDAPADSEPARAALLLGVLETEDAPLRVLGPGADLIPRLGTETAMAGCPPKVCTDWPDKLWSPGIAPRALAITIAHKKVSFWFRVAYACCRALPPARCASTVLLPTRERS